MHYYCMAYSTLSVRQDVVKRLRAAKATGESYSDLLARLLDDQPAKTVGEWLESLAPLEGRGVFTPAERARLLRDHVHSRDSRRRIKRNASA